MVRTPSSEVTSHRFSLLDPKVDKPADDDQAKDDGEDDFHALFALLSLSDVAV